MLDIRKTIISLVTVTVLSYMVLIPTAIAQSEDKPKLLNLWQLGDPGERLYIDGRVTTPDGRPIAGAVLNIWQADGTGEYQGDRYRATLTTQEDGAYAFGTVLPGQYYGTKHIHVVIDHDNYRAVQTQILFQGDPYLDEDTDRNRAIFLEEGQAKGEKILYGRFDIKLNPN